MAHQNNMAQNMLPEGTSEPSDTARTVNALCGGVAVLAVCGNIYGFSSFSDAMKTQLQFSDSQMSLFSSASNLGFCLGPHVGWLVDRFGPQRVSILGAVTAGFAYACIGWLLWFRWASVDLMTLLFIIGGQGSMCSYMAVSA